MPDSEYHLKPEQANRSILKWVIATVAGFIAAHLSSEFLVQHSGRLNPEILHANMGAVCGFVIGGCQGWYFYKYGPSIWRAWLAASLVGWMVGYLLQAWALDWTARPIIERFGGGIGTTLSAQAIMGACSGLPIVAAQAFVLTRFMPNYEWKSWSVQAWTSFVLAGISYAIFVRICHDLLPSLFWGSGNSVLITLGWALKGAVVGVMTGRVLLKSRTKSG